MRYARGDGDKPPSLLTLALQCQRWQALPEAGGILNQPAGLLAKMGLLAGVYNATKMYYSAADTAKFAGSHTDMWELYAWARRVESEHGN